MLASLQSFGSSPELMDCWLIAVIAGASSVAQVWITLLGISSGPPALLTVRFFSNLCTPS
ncbi:hypothetical protein DPMN_165533 [Dreissena polymorpha]|uniref:Uncharacterized protein n=1 Tax=Dreissena polymorpha TaxID=45954 RepID=A0A9D4EXD8_DREPO|nr:hypothetical protein DPMN_165533 [Dreissena polymorpha]